MTTLLWLRRDLRTLDHPALTAAAAAGDVVVCFVLDPRILASAGPVRTGWLAANLLELNASLGGRLCLRSGDPISVIGRLATEVGAQAVQVTLETEPSGAARDAAVRADLARRGIAWRATGSPYAVTPGRVSTRDGGGFKVFSAFARAWRAHGWPSPPPIPDELQLIEVASEPGAWKRLNAAVADCPVPLPVAGQDAALAAWHRFLHRRLDDYAVHRDRPDLKGTSMMSAYLKFGVVHPRTLLTDLAGRTGYGAERYVAELAWREFYADVLARHPYSLTADLNELPIAYDEPGEQLSAWREGRTGYPIVDAGQRQLLATGWMHNRVRMISASFLTKDLHLWWPLGANHFAEHLLDADLASNAHGWQWVAGTGTDAAPYFRVFNPVTQGERFDPSGDYVRRWIPELAHLHGAAAHQPWTSPDGYTHGYPARIVDHEAERLEALDRYHLARV